MSPWISSPPHLPHPFASASPLPAQFVSWSDCLPLPPPQWHLAILICMYMPSLCGPWAGQIDQQCRVLLHVSRKQWLPHAIGAHVCEHMQACIPAGTHVDGLDAQQIYTHKQTHTVCASPADFDTLQTYMQRCTLETWLKGFENTHIFLDSAPRGSIRILSLSGACVCVGISV